MSESWKERPIDVRAVALEEASDQRRREVAGRSAPTRSPVSRSQVDRGPVLVRDPNVYPTYPKSGRFRFHGYAKGYMYRWELFLRGRTDEVPPTFYEYIKDGSTASEDTRKAEAQFSPGGKRDNDL